MAEDLSSFIEQQKIKLEKERADLSRNGNYTSTSQDYSEYGRNGNSREIEKGKRHSERDSPIQSKKNDNQESGLPLGGYERIQQKLKEERRLEYNKYLAEKNMRSTGKVDSVLKEKDTSPLNKYNSENRRRSIERSYENDARDSFIPRSRRKGKENWDIDDNYQDDRGSLRQPLKETYEDILRRKRTDERRYRGDRFGYDGPDLDDELRLMKLSSRNYKYNSRSDGYLSRQYDDFDDKEVGLRHLRGGRRRDRSIESKRVRFHDDDDYEDINDNIWSNTRRRFLLNDYDDKEDDLNVSQRRSHRSDRISSAHDERTVNHENKSLRRGKTDSEIRSQSAPLIEGVGTIGESHVETKEMKIKRQEQYKRELDQQLQQREENKKKEKMESLSNPSETVGYAFEPNVPTKTPGSTSRTSAPGRQDLQDPYSNLGNNGPSSRPSQHPSLYPSPYDDPYYYYGRQERGAPQATVIQDPLSKDSKYGVRGFYDDSDAGPSDQSQGKSKQTDYARTPVSRRGQGVNHTHQPPGGYSNISGIPGVGQSSPEEDKLSKRAAQQAYQEELRKQMELREEQKRKEKEEKEKYDRKKDEEIANYDPWGKGGAGAPLRNTTGQVLANLRMVQQDGQDGKTSVSPRNAAPSLDASPSQQPQYTNYQDSKATYSSPFGRSDPLKERQPHDDLKEKARLEYQQYLKLQVEEKERKKKEEQERIRAQEEREEMRLKADREKMQKEYLMEQEKIRKKEEEAKKQNEMIIEAQNAKKREAERKRKEMEDRRQDELRKKLDENIAAKKMGAGNSDSTFRSDSPPIPTMRKQVKQGEENMTDMTRDSSPSVPALAKIQKQDSSKQQYRPVSPAPSSEPHLRQPSPQSKQKRIEPDSDVLSQLTALRQQLKKEEQKMQSQIGHSTATIKYSQMGRIDNESRRTKRDVSVFDRALTNKPGVKRTETDHYSAADEFNRMKHEDTSSLAGEFRSRFPQAATTDSMLDLQQQEYLREQEDKLSTLKSDVKGSRAQPSGIESTLRPKSKESLLESESQFIAVDDPSQIIPTSQTAIIPRQPSARERRRWKQLEEMAKEPKPYNVYKPPTPGGVSLNSVTSFNVYEVAAKNEERMRRLQAMKRSDPHGQNNVDPDDVLQQFMNGRRRPLTRTSEATLEAETAYQPATHTHII